MAEETMGGNGKANQAKPDTPKERKPEKFKFTAPSSSVTRPTLKGAANWDRWYQTMLGRCQVSEISTILEGYQTEPEDDDEYLQWKRRQQIGLRGIYVYRQNCGNDDPRSPSECWRKISVANVVHTASCRGKGKARDAFQHRAFAGRLIATYYELGKVNVVSQSHEPSGRRFVQHDELIWWSEV